MVPNRGALQLLQAWFGASRVISALGRWKTSLFLSKYSIYYYILLLLLLLHKKKKFWSDFDKNLLESFRIVFLTSGAPHILLPSTSSGFGDQGAFFVLPLAPVGQGGSVVRGSVVR